MVMVVELSEQSINGICWTDTRPGEVYHLLDDKRVVVLVTTVGSQKFGVHIGENQKNAFRAGDFASNSKWVLCSAKLQVQIP